MDSATPTSTAYGWLMLAGIFVSLATQRRLRQWFSFCKSTNVSLACLP